MEEKKFENQIGNWVYKGIELTEEDIRKAMANSTSNKKAAEFREDGATGHKQMTNEEAGKFLGWLLDQIAAKG
jgi:hypothetical protein